METTKRDSAAAWLAKNLGLVMLSALLAVVGWAINTNVESVQDDIRENTQRLETISTNLQLVVVEQSSQEQRIKHLESVVESHTRRLAQYDANILQFYRDHGKTLNDRGGSP